MVSLAIAANVTDDSLQAEVRAMLFAAAAVPRTSFVRGVLRAWLRDPSRNRTAIAFVAAALRGRVADALRGRVADAVARN